MYTTPIPPSPNFLRIWQCEMVLPSMAAVRAAESDSPVCLVCQLYSNDDPTELPE